MPNQTRNNNRFTPHSRPVPKDWRGSSKEELLDALQKLAQKLGRMPKHKEINDSPLTPSVTTYRNKFGSLQAAADQLGLTITNDQYSKQELIHILQTFHKETGNVPCSTDFGENKAPDTPKCDTFYRHLGDTWNDVLKNAEFTQKEIETRNIEFSKETILEKLYKFYEEKGQAPYPSDLRTNRDPEYPSYATINKKFGGIKWENILHQANIPTE